MKAQVKKPEQTTKHAPEKDAYTVNEFCARNGMSRHTFYKLRKLGVGPREMRVLRRIKISVEAAAEWRKDREADAKA